MATIPKSAITVKRGVNEGPPMQFFFPEAASQTFKIGKLVYLNGSGNVADFTASVDSGSQRLLGVAAEGGNNLTTAFTQNAIGTGTFRSQIGGGLVGVYVGPYTIFEANISSNGSDVVALQTHYGSLLPFCEDTTVGANYIDVANTGSKLVACSVLKPSGQFGDRFTVGDTNQRFEFTLTPGKIQVLGTN